MNSNYTSSDFGLGLTDNRHDTVTMEFKDDNVCGEGASCRIYRMRLNGLLVAVKRLRHENITNPVYLASYRKEFHIGQRLKHDALPVYRDMRIMADEVYIVMDFVDGVNLEDFVRTPEGKEYFSNRENARRFFKELLNVVGYMHRSGVIHCDLKLANIMLRNSDRGVMLLDFDKSYCDIMDLTHGGTASISDPLEPGQKPTAQKDFNAIGLILDSIARTVSRFPESWLRSFHKECISGNATADSLLNKLQTHNYTWLWRLSIMALIVLGITSIILKVAMRDPLSTGYPRTGTDTTTTTSVPPAQSKGNDAGEQRRSDSLTLSATIQAPDKGKEQNKNPETPNSLPNIEHSEIRNTSSGKEDDPQRRFMMPTEEESRKNVPQYLLDMELDIDYEMREILAGMRDGISTIQTSGMDYQECKKLVDSLSREEFKSYLRAVDKCIEMYPEIYEEEIITEMTRRMDYSQVSKLFQKMHETLRQLDKGNTHDNKKQYRE